MSCYSRLFVISSLIYLLIGGILGIFMASFPSLRGMIHFSHAHTMVIGWISMMIFGLAYHVIPRFSGSPLIPDCFQKLHWWLANSGMVGMMIVPVLQLLFYTYLPLLNILFFIFGLLQFLGILIFVIQISKALKFLNTPFSKPKACCTPCDDNTKFK